MTRMELRRKAPEVQSVDRCSVCGMQPPPGPRDHLLVGTPGVPSHDGAVCEGCGSVLEHVVSKFGGELSVSVREAKQRADGSEITVPRPPRPIAEQTAPNAEEHGAVVLLRDPNRAGEALGALEQAGFSAADATVLRREPNPPGEA